MGRMLTAVDKHSILNNMDEKLTYDKSEFFFLFVIL